MKTYDYIIRVSEMGEHRDDASPTPRPGHGSRPMRFG